MVIGSAVSEDKPFEAVILRSFYNLTIFKFSLPLRLFNKCLAQAWQDMTWNVTRAPPLSLALLHPGAHTTLFKATYSSQT
ncbi:hypothetical protein ASD70_09900 [Pseudomonas sp. Root569]|nr:hypothetical protein ASD70_09900 [Pseudomonas sp. Root569]